MAIGARRGVRVILAAVLLGGLCACQATGDKPTVEAAASPSGMQPDIRRILSAGGLDANAPGALKTAQMPPEVQQAVAALQGIPATAPAGAVPSPAAGTPAAPPMIAAGPPVGRHGKRGRKGDSQYALAPVQPSATAATVLTDPIQAASQQASSAPPQQALAYAGAQGGLPAPTPAQQSPIPSAFGQAAQQAAAMPTAQQIAAAQAAQQAALQPPQLSAVQSYLPAPPPQIRTVVLTGPNADRRAAQAALVPQVAVPSRRATQAAVNVMASSATSRAAPVVPVAPAKAPEPEEPRIRRF